MLPAKSGQAILTRDGERWSTDNTSMVEILKTPCVQRGNVEPKQIRGNHHYKDLQSAKATNQNEYQVNHP